jgi:hypothetical protein
MVKIPDFEALRDRSSRLRTVTEKAMRVPSGDQIGRPQSPMQQRE